MSEKKATVFCELLLERYIYLRITQKRQKGTKCVRCKVFLEVCVVDIGVYLKPLGSILSKLGVFLPLCIEIGG